MLGVLWTIVNSPAGQAVVAGAALWIWRKLSKGDKRSELIFTRFAPQAFELVEVLSVADPRLRSTAKWVEFLKVVTAKMHAAGLGDPSDGELERLQAFADAHARVTPTVPKVAK